MGGAGAREEVEPAERDKAPVDASVVDPPSMESSDGEDFLSADESFSDDGSLATSGSMRSPPNATVGGSAPEENEEGDDRNDGDEEAASVPPPTRGREEEQEPAVQATVAPSGDLPELEVARAESRRTSEAEDSAQRDQRASASPQTTLVDAKSDSVKVRDAGTGKEYVLEKVYRIKDLDTGTEFLVDAKDGMEGQGAQVVKRADTGEEISMDQFERNLGLQSPLMREMSRRSGEGGGPRGGAPKLIDSSDDEGEAVRKSRGGGGAKQGGGRKRWFQKGLNSLKHKALNAGDAINEAFLKHKAGQGGAEESTFDEAGPGASGAGGDGDDFWTPGAKPSGRRVKVQVHKKIYKEFTDLRIVQEIGAHKGAVWSMKFSLDGLYLASAGQDEIVRIWQVREGHGNRGDGGDPSSGSAGSATFFHQKPYRLYGGHKADILDLCWSKTQFLLSSSMDKTVRLWHISMNECLRVFSHTDFVTSIQFHPVDDKYFLSGSLDEKARLWSIPEQTVVDWVNVHEMVTAVCFSPDGKKAVIGSYKGKCRFYSVEGNQFEYITQMDVKNTRGKNSRGKKITGLQYMPGVERFLLVTSNDSRIRMYDGFTLCCKYKGHRNANSQIASGFSPGGGFVACGSEDGSVCIWSTINTFIPSVNPFYTGYRSDKNASCEQFLAHDDIVTSAIFAPLSDDVTARVSRNLGIAPPTAAAEALVKPSLKRLGLGGKTKADQEREDAQRAGDMAMKAAAAVGQTIVTSGFSGEIRVFENIGLPIWL